MINEITKVLREMLPEFGFIVNDPHQYICIKSTTFFCYVDFGGGIAATRGYNKYNNVYYLSDPEFSIELVACDIISAYECYNENQHDCWSATYLLIE